MRCCESFYSRSRREDVALIAQLEGGKRYISSISSVKRATIIFKT